MIEESYPTQGQKPGSYTETPPSDPTPPDTYKPKCEPLPEGDPPPKPPKRDPCDQPCCCPKKPGDDGTCLDDLIANQEKQIIAADRATKLKADLDDILKKAKLAKQDYTKEKYKALRDRWENYDGLIASLLIKLRCCVPCWQCVVECEICPLLYAIREAELKLNGNWALIKDVYSLRDLQYWHTRNRDAKKAVVDRIRSVLTAWESPAQALDKALTGIKTLIDQSTDNLAKDAAQAIADIYLKVLPLHFMIAPRDAKTKIESVFLDVCKCDDGKTDDCCGPDAGRLSIRQQLLNPLPPYIVDPNDLFDIICCLVKHRYIPAKDQLTAAEAELAVVESDIKRAITDIDAKKASILNDYKANVVNPIDCDIYKRKGSDPNNPCNGGKTPPPPNDSYGSQTPQQRTPPAQPR